ncbi:SPOR domain-containing protein [Bacillus sp. FJAT-44742]|uniref:SPOR domain-containing protein n=1 Tax=Bacillus sp. FJAT-44742 TaxID=2014005 RepID=UPI0012FED765|nr:SPOR domain-containing protein [Bacillus sp. FJAT-44742]
MSKDNNNRLSFKLYGKDEEKERESKPLSFTEKEDGKEKEDDDSSPQLKVIDFGKKKKQWKEKTAPFWDDGKRDLSPGLPFNRKKKKNERRFQDTFKGLPLKISMIIGGAMVMGLLFGFIVLHLLTGSPGGEASTSSSALPASAEQSSAVAASYNNELNLNIVQAGAFSTLEKGEEMKAGLEQKGFPTLLTDDGDLYYLLVGMMPSRENASVMQSYYNEQGSEVFLKTRNIPAPVLDSWSDDGKLWFEKSRSSLESLLDQSGSAISSSASVELSQDAAEAEQLYEKVKGEIPEEGQAFFENLKIAFEKAENGSSAQESHQEAMKTVLSYEKFIEGVE